MEEFLLNLIKEKLTKNSKELKIENSAIRNQLKLADIDLKQIALDVAQSFDLEDTSNLNIDKIRERQITVNITDEHLLGYFEQKKYAQNSMSKIKDRIKITTRLDEIQKERSLDFNRNQYERRSKTKSLNLDKAELNNGYFRLKTDYIVNEPHVCLLNDLSELTKIHFKEMTVNQVHSGKYIEGTVILAPFYTSGLNLVIKDTDNQIENVLLFNYEAKSSNLEPTILIPIGTKIAIKEPYLQTMYGLNDCVIRIDSPSDLVVLKYGSNESQNDMSQVHYAIRFYSKEIDKLNKKKSQLYLNRAKLYLNLEKYTMAHQDAVQAYKIDTNNSEAHLLAGKSLYLMRKFHQARDQFQKCLKMNPKNHCAKFELDKTNSRLAEATTGFLDLQSLIDQYNKNENLFFDVSDYKTSKIEITNFENKSKGVRAVEFIEKGTLLVVSKAVSSVFNNKIDYKDKGFLRVHLNENIYEKRDMSVILSDLAYKLKNDSDLAGEVYKLYAGDQYDRDNVDQQKNFVDIRRIEKILAKNSFDVKNHVEAVDMQNLWSQYKNQLRLLQFNVNQLDLIDLDSINFESDQYKQLAQLQTKYNNLSQQRGLWLMPSYFNHSCLANSFHICIGDLMFIYSRRDINEGEEITLNYFAAELKYSERVERCLSVHEFKCDCDLCRLDEKDTMRDAREQLVKNIFSKSNQSVNEAELDVKRMKCTYLKRDKYQFCMIYPLEVLAAKYRNESKYLESAKCYEEIFQITKNFSEFISLASLKEAYEDYKKLNDFDKSETCKLKAINYFVNFKAYFDLVWNKINLKF